VKSFNDAHPDFGFARTPVEDQRYDDGNEQEPPPPTVVVVVAPDVGGGVVGVGPPGPVHPSAPAATNPATTRHARRRDLCMLTSALTAVLPIRSSQSLTLRP
jgi:hypothetical protein